MESVRFGPVERPSRFVYLIVGQMLFIITAFAYLNLLRIEYFIISSFVIALITAELTAPLAVRPEWRSRLRWILVSWFVLFGAVAFRRIATLWAAL